MRTLIINIRLLLFSFLILVNCATHKATISSYVDPTFGNENIKKIAIFPIRNANIAPGESQQLNRKISMALKQRNPNCEIMSSVEATKILNDHDLSYEWSYFLDSYISSGIPDANTLKKFGEILGVNAILQGEVVNIFQQDGEYRLYGQGNKGITRVTVRLTMLSADNGKMIWEASSEGIRKTATTIEEAPPIIEAIDLAIDKILNTLPNFNIIDFEEIEEITEAEIPNIEIIGEIYKVSGKYGAVKLSNSNIELKPGMILYVYDEQFSKVCSAKVIKIGHSKIAIKIFEDNREGNLEVGQLISEK